MKALTIWGGRGTSFVFNRFWVPLLLALSCSSEVLLKRESNLLSGADESCGPHLDIIWGFSSNATDDFLRKRTP